VSGNNYVKGTFTTSDGSMTLTPTHYWGAGGGLGLEAKWYSKQDLKAPAVLKALTDHNDGDPVVTAEDIDALFTALPFTYAISGSTLTLTQEGGSPQTYTKQ